MLAGRTVSIQGMPGSLHVARCELQILLDTVNHTTTAWWREGRERGRKGEKEGGREKKREEGKEKDREGEKESEREKEKERERKWRERKVEREGGRERNK